MILELTAFAVIGLLTFVLVQAFTRLNRDPVRQRLLRSADSDVNGSSNDDDSWAQSLAEQMPFNSDQGKLDRDLLRAGYYGANARRDYLAMRNSVVIGIVVLAGLVAVTLGPDNEPMVLRVLGVGFSIAGIAWALPRVLLRARGDARVNRIRRDLPNALDMTTMCVTGGLSLQDAIGRISKELYFSHPDLAVEMFIVRQHASISSLSVAFQNFAKRTDAPEIVSLAALIKQAQMLGADMAETLGEFADEMRESRQQLADEQSNKASVKLLFPVTLCLVPAACIILWGPAALQMMEFLRDFGNAP